MASEYYKWKFKDVQPDAPPPPLTRKEQVQNWFYYHKWHLVVGVVVLAIVLDIALTALLRVKPDYILGYIAGRELSEETVEAVETALAALGEDVNGDRRVVVELRQYILPDTGDEETAVTFAYAADTVLVADMTAGDVYIYLMDDPTAVQRAYQILANWDGTPPADSDFSPEGKVVAWGDCPTLAALGLPQEEVGGLYVGRRCYHGKAALEHGQDEAFWEALMKGVNP